MLRILGLAGLFVATFATQVFAAVVTPTSDVIFEFDTTVLGGQSITTYTWSCVAFEEPACNTQPGQGASDVPGSLLGSMRIQIGTTPGGNDIVSFIENSGVGAIFGRSATFLIAPIVPPSASSIFMSFSFINDPLVGISQASLRFGNGTSVPGVFFDPDAPGNRVPLPGVPALLGAGLIAVGALRRSKGA
ncbi:MAG: hypothetical protein QNJ91_00585 [Gammaproteobacteria bacterium]|nr:hypothetical protein [Gammaproteobacteria bacterium]